MFNRRRIDIRLEVGGKLRSDPSRARHQGYDRLARRSANHADPLVERGPQASGELLDVGDGLAVRRTFAFGGQEAVNRSRERQTKLFRHSLALCLARCEEAKFDAEA